VNWYALHCRSNAEKSIQRRLEDDGVESYYPATVKPASHGRRETEQKYFPGYLFAKFDLEHRAPVSRLNQVIGILGWRNEPIAIPEAEIEAVRLMVTNSVHRPAVHDYVTAGDKVTVVSGPLQGLSGFVISRKNAVRIVVSVTMLARSIAAEVDAHTLELVAKAQCAA